MNKLPLPFALPLIEQGEINEVIDSLQSGWLTTGPKTKQFEADFSKFAGQEYAIAVNSATAGLHLALEAIGIQPRDKVITTTYTFTATAEVIRYLGADPILIDIEPDTFNIDVQKIEEAITQNKNVKAIIPVHFAGQACDMKTIINLAEKYSLKIIEDAAHALPTTYNGQLIGTIGDITVYSFYATKTIATGEGGMVVTNNKQYADRMKTMRLHGISSDVFNRYQSDKPSWYYEVIAPGFKYNMTDIAASLGIHQLRKAWDFQTRRQWIAEQYTEAFAGLPMTSPFIAQPKDTHAWHLYVIQLHLDKITITRDAFIEEMSNLGIGTSVHFIPLHLHPYWRDKYSYQPEDFPVAWQVFNQAVSLPIYPKMMDSDVARVIDAVQAILVEYAK